MKKITAGKKIALGLLLAAVVSFLICRHGDGHEIQSAAFLSSQDGFLYGMDITDDSYYLFRTDESTGYSRTVRVSRLGGDGTVRISDLTVGNDGKVYFYYEKAGTGSERWIGTCDFIWGKIRKTWDFKEITDGYYWLLDSNGKEIFMETNDSEAHVHEWILDQESMGWEERGEYLLQSVAGEFLFDAKFQWRIDPRGNIYVQEKETKEVCAFENDGSQIGTSNCRYQLRDGELHFLNLESGDNYTLEFTDGKGKLRVCETCVADTELKERFGYVSDVEMAENGQAVGFTWSGGKKVPFVYGENSFSLLRLQASPKDQAFQILVLTLAVFLLMTAVYFVIKLICMWNGGVFPLLAQMFFIGIPLFAAVCIRSSDMLDKILVDRLLETEMDGLVQAAVLYRNSIGTGDRILSGEPGDDMGEGRYLLRSAYHDMTDGKEKWEADVYYAFSYSYRDGEIYNLSDGYGFTVPLSYMSGKDFYEALQETVKKNMPVTLSHQDVNGNWLSVFVPYYDRDGNVTAVVELREDIQSSLARISKPVQMATRAIFLGFGALAAAVLLIILFSLLPLRSLSRAVGEISRGKLDIQVKESLRFTEIGRISQVFNQMSFNISRTMRELTEIGRQYAMFIPVQFLGYLGRESILETKHGDYAEEEFVVMEISSSDFEAVSGVITGQQTFEVINQALERMIPVLEEHGGMVTNFTNAGALSIYKDDGNQALSAAVSVLQSMNRECLKAGENPLAYTAGICFGPVRLGIIGAGHRSEAAAMSLNCQFAGMLQRMAVKYGAGLLITGEAVKHVRNFESDYHSRTLGYVLFTSKNVVDVIYDVYDGDDADKRQLKKQTKELFETGVKLYMGAQFLEARNCFVRVLFENRNDLAARQYFAFCEEHLNGEKDEKDCHYIEVF